MIIAVYVRVLFGVITTTRLSLLLFQDAFDLVWVKGTGKSVSLTLEGLNNSMGFLKFVV